MKNTTKLSIIIDVNVSLSLWSAIKLRIAGKEVKKYLDITSGLQKEFDTTLCEPALAAGLEEVHK